MNPLELQVLAIVSGVPATDQANPSEPDGTTFPQPAAVAPPQNVPPPPRLVPPPASR
jgi:hypothetical protein